MAVQCATVCLAVAAQELYLLRAHAGSKAAGVHSHLLLARALAPQYLREVVLGLC